MISHSLHLVVYLCPEVRDNPPVRVIYPYPHTKTVCLKVSITNYRVRVRVRVRVHVYRVRPVYGYQCLQLHHARQN